MSKVIKKWVKETFVWSMAESIKVDLYISVQWNIFYLFWKEMLKEYAKIVFLTKHYFPM